MCLFLSCSKLTPNSRSVASIDYRSCENALSSFSSVNQFIRSEQLLNTERFRKDESIHAINFVLVDRTDIEILDIGASHNLKSIIYDNDKIRWYHHPYNISPKVPYQNLQVMGAIDGKLSASRSIFINPQEELYSIKLATSHPHKDIASTGKDNLKNDSILSIKRSKFIRDIDQIRGEDESFKILTEVLSIRSISGDNGYSIRDLRSLQKGHNYLPAFSIPYANIDGLDEVYAQAVARAKALLLMRYGLQMKTPNAQNWLLELDDNLMPTGRIFLRDLADSAHIEFIAKHIGAKSQMKEDRQHHFSVMNYINSNFDTSFWQFDEGGVSFDRLSQLKSIHDLSYVDTICNELGIANSFSDHLELQSYLKSKEGQEHLASYARQLGLQGE